MGTLIETAALLIVDDEPGMRNFLVRTLQPRCKYVAEAGDTKTASKLIGTSPFDLILLDNVMEGKSGLAWLNELRGAGFYTDVILMTAFADLATAIEAVRAGASDFVLKPFRTNQILNSITHCLDRARLRRENFVLRHELQSMPRGGRPGCDIVGQSSDVMKLRDFIARVAPLATTVLITGESGTGKEMTARALHNFSPRAEKPFVPVNCAAIPAEMIESELFGHLKGAFTGAASSREGLFSYAQGGTLLLDEIGELPQAMQAKLLRAIEEKRIRPVGAEREIPIDVRIVAATNSDLNWAVAAGLFRQDLYYRLNVAHVALTPLRDRPADIAPLAQMFLDRLPQELGLPPLQIEPVMLSALERYSWPGNVRELRNVIERSVILGGIPNEFLAAKEAPGKGASITLESVEKQHILSVLEDAGGNRAEAARRLGISRKTLDRKCALWDV